MKKPAPSAIYLPVGLAILLLIIWTIATSRNTSLIWLFPKPIDIFKVFFTHTSLLWEHAIVTIEETLVGLSVSIFLGVLAAIGMDRWKALYKTIYPFIIISQTIPIIALAPILILWFGYGILAKIFIVALVCFFPIAVNLYDGFQQVSIENIRLLRSMNASPWQIFRLLKIPSALPAFFTGIKLSVSYSVMAAIIGEWLGGEKGLGIYMTRATKSYQTSQVFAIILIIIALSLLLYGIVILLESFFLKWRFTRMDEYFDTENI